VSILVLALVVQLSDPVRYAVGPYAVTADDEQFYAVRNKQMARIARDGTIRDVDPIEQEGDAFGVVAGNRVVAVLTYSNKGIALTGFSRDGARLWRRQLADAGRNWVFFDGTAFVNITNTIERYDETGQLLESHALRNDASLGGAAKAGDGYVLLWSSFKDGNFAEFVETDGDVVARVPIPRGPFPSPAHALASNGDDVVVLWYENGVQAMRFGRRGLTGGPAVLGKGGGYYDTEAVIWDGQRYRIAWSAADGTHVADLAEGVSFASHVRLGDTGSPKLATAAGRTLLVSGKRNFILEPGQSVSQLGASAGPAMLERGWDEVPAVAWAGDRYVAAWRHTSPERAVSIRARFFAANGKALGASFPVADVPGYLLYGMSIAATQDTVLVAWPGGARRFDLHGVLLDPEPLPLDFWFKPTVAASADHFILLNTRTVGCTLLALTFGARDAVVGPLSPLITSCPGAPWTGELARPQVVWDGSAFAVRIDEIEAYATFDARIERYAPSLLRVSPSGVATRPVQFSSWTYSTGLATADGRYLAPTDDGMFLIPFDLSAPENARNAVQGSTAAFSTGREVIVLAGHHYVVLTKDGSSRSVGSLPRDAAAGAGDGDGGALIAWPEWDYTDENDGVIFGTVLPHASKHRAARP
jgi:hypothetical protein